MVIDVDLPSGCASPWLAVPPEPSFLGRVGRLGAVWSLLIAAAIAAGSGAAFGIEGRPGEAEVRALAQSVEPVPRQAPRAARRKPPAQVTLPDPSGEAYRSPPHAESDGMDECWERLRAARRPSRLVRMSEACEREFPDGAFAEQMLRIAQEAGKVLEAQLATGLSGDFFEDSVGDEAYQANLAKAIRGDREAAYLISRAYREGGLGVERNPRRMEQWLRIAAELGNALASWELAEYYNYTGLVADAARFEKKALELGFKPAVRLPSRGY